MSLNTNSNALALKLQARDATREPTWVRYSLITIALIFFLTRYRRCPSDKILVIYGQGVGKSGESAKCVHGGGALIWPVIQSFGYLNLTPISIEVDLRKALSKQNIRVDVPSNFTIAVSTEPEIT